MPDFRPYVDEAKWALCALERGKKGPAYKNWNLEPLKADMCEELPGAGLLHSLSGTVALDIDNLALARTWLADRGVDLDQLLEADDAVGVSSGTPNRAKLLYRMRNPMITLKPANSGIELRCATANGTSVHDALPPSVHPSGRRYEWVGGPLGDWRALPAIPASLLGLWRSLAADEPAGLALARVETTQPSVDLKRLRQAAFQHDPNCQYDEWIGVGWSLAEETQGAAEGLEIWQDWSRGVTRVPYPGDELLKAKYLGFKLSGKSKPLEADLPAQAEDFEIILPESDEVRLAELNEKKAKVEGKANAIAEMEKNLIYVRSVEHYFDFGGHKVLNSDSAIRHLYRPKMPRGKGGRRLDPLPILEDSTTKTIVDALGFNPGADRIFYNKRADATYVNTYKNKLPEPLEPTTAEREVVEWLFDRIEDDVFREYLRQFLGHVVQHPGVKIASAPLIWSEIQGNGKSTILGRIPQLLVGEMYSAEVTQSLLNSPFNDHIIGKWHVNLAEFRAGTRGEREAISAMLKAWITDPVVAAHPKGKPSYTMPNHFFVTATSNKEDAAAIDNNDRRWAIHELDAPAFTKSERNWVYGFLESERAAAVLRWYFLNVSLDGFDPSAEAPVTAAKIEMAEESIASDVEYLQRCFEECSGPLEKDVVVVGDVTREVHRNCMAKPSTKRVSRILAKLGGVSRQVRVRKGRFRCSVIRDHPKWQNASESFVADYISNGGIDSTD